MRWITYFVTITTFLNFAHAQSWLPWGSWGSCYAECGTGLRYRVRYCQIWEASNPFSFCRGPRVDSKPCRSNKICGFGDPIWANWGPWERCSKPCGYGNQNRYRKCVASSNQECLESQSQFCNTFPCSNGGNINGGSNLVGVNWGQWQQWSQCSRQCGGGEKTRIRECAGRHQCRGNEVKACNIHPCGGVNRNPSDSWTNWSRCSASCEGGQQTRTKTSRTETRQETRACNIQWCDSPARRNSWTEWSQCTASCGGGQQTRSKTTGFETRQETRACNIEWCGSQEWSNWGSWSRCSTRCGEGTQTRTRDCVASNRFWSSLSSCEGPKTQSRQCKATSECDPTWSQWDSWGRCSKTCGDGIARRSRTCLHGQNNQCRGNPSGLKQCSLRKCPAVWSSWSKWSDCSKTCGDGRRQRSRTCGKGENTCRGKGIQSQNCKSEDCLAATQLPRRPVDSKSPRRRKLSAKSRWGKWGNWVTCSETCGPGARLRIRTCKSRRRRCEGNNVEIGECQIKECSRDKWTDWTSWSECLGPCGVTGWTIRTRSCEGGQAGEGNCLGSNVQNKKCLEECPAPEWNEWETWGRCTKTCGKGTRSRTRACADNSKNCAGRNQMTENCNEKECEKDPEWSKWSTWSECSTSCGGGVVSRSRKCIGKSQNCKGKGSETKSCNTRQCRKEWNKWGEWSECSASCGDATRTRTRTCKTEGCKGPESFTEDCKLDECPKRPEWREWAHWSSCTATCGSGARIRIRICEGGANACEGSNVMSEECNTEECKTEPTWSDWTLWSQCSVTCGRGERNRIRVCSEGAGVCKGRDEETEKCQTQPCTKPPVWRKWAKWSECSKTCNGGIRTRTRSCSDDSQTCEGQSVASEDCNTMNCVPAWNEWGQWSECTATCGKATRQRQRTCRTRECSGQAMLMEDCKLDECPKEWNAWGEWSECSATCGDATRQRQRRCKTKGCEGSTKSEEKCRLIECPNKCRSIQAPRNGKIIEERKIYVSGNIVSFECDFGYQIVGESSIQCLKNGNWEFRTPSCVLEWSKWEKWTECTRTCGEGTQFRRRTCNVEECQGDAVAFNSCNTQVCPATWLDWGAWSGCTTTCGPGGRVRTRVCSINSQPSSCTGKSIETEECNEKACRPKNSGCEKVKPPLNGNIRVIRNRSYQTGTVLAFKCSSQFAVRGALRTTCQSNGEWSHPPPFCSARNCKKDPKPPHVCAKSCRKGDDCVGLSKFCLCDGKCGMSCFDPDQKCSMPVAPEHGHVDFIDHSYGHFANYSCDKGFVLSGSKSRRCQSDGKWSGTVPSCQVASACGQAGDIGSIFLPAGARIVGGTNAEEGAWPWQGLIIGSGSGITDIPKSEVLPSSAQIFKSSQIVIHPQYDNTKFYDFDVALVETGKKMSVRNGRYIQTKDDPIIEFTAEVRPVCLPCVNPDVKKNQQISIELVRKFNNVSCAKESTVKTETLGKAVVTGFGRTEIYKEKLPNVLQQALLTIQSESECAKAILKIREDPQFAKANFTEQMMCTRSASQLRQMDACSGDSGGPLVRLIEKPDGSQYWVQEGIVSWGYGCALVEEGMEYPGYFTKLSSVMDFIVKYVKDS